MGNRSKPVGAQHGIGSLPHRFKRRTSRNALIGEQPEHLAALWHVVIGGDAEVVDPLFCGRFGIVAMPPDVMNHALNQVVVQLPEALLNEAQKVHMDHGFAQLPQPVDGVILHERRIVADVLRGYFQMREQLLREPVQLTGLFFTLHFSFDLTITEVPWVALQ